MVGIFPIGKDETQKLSRLPSCLWRHFLRHIYWDEKLYIFFIFLMALDFKWLIFVLSFFKVNKTLNIFYFWNVLDIIFDAAVRLKFLSHDVRYGLVKSWYQYRYCRLVSRTIWGCLWFKLKTKQNWQVYPSIWLGIQFKNN